MKRQDPMKPVGVWEVRRRITIPALVQAADASTVERAVSALSGVCKVVADGDRHWVDVRYDSSRSDYQEIEAALKNAGFPPLDSWWSRFKGRLFQYSDTNARDNAHAPPPACCNKPPK